MPPPRLVALFGLACVAATGGPQAELPSVTDILEHVRVASGTRPDSFRETTEQSSSGLARHTVLVESGADFREDTDEGPFHTERGRFGGQAWRQNRNGETILQAPDPGLVAPESTVDVVQRIASPVDGFVVSSFDAHGYGTRRYVEAATWHVVREDVVRASGTRVTQYDDFRTIDGYTLAFHTTSTDGHPENDREKRVTAFGAATVTPGEIAIPPSRRSFVEFPAGTRTVVLPVGKPHRAEETVLSWYGRSITSGARPIFDLTI